MLVSGQSNPKTQVISCLWQNVITSVP